MEKRGSSSRPAHLQWLFSTPRESVLERAGCPRRGVCSVGYLCRRMQIAGSSRGAHNGNTKADGGSQACGGKTDHDLGRSQTPVADSPGCNEGIATRRRTQADVLGANRASTNS